MLELTLRRALAAFFALELAGCASLQTQPPRQADDSNAALTAFAVGTSVLVGAVVVIVIIKSESGGSASSTKPPARPSSGAPEHDVVTELGWNVESRGGDATWRRCTSRTFCTEERVTIDAGDLVEATKSGRVVPVLMDGRPSGEVDLYVLRVRRGASTR